MCKKKYLDLFHCLLNMLNQCKALSMFFGIDIISLVELYPWKLVPVFEILFCICRNLFVIGKEERWTQGFMDKRGTKNTLPSHPRESINKPVIPSRNSILGVSLQETYSSKSWRLCNICNFVITKFRPNDIIACT